MIVVTSLHDILYCCETENKVHKFKEFMDCWDMILFYRNFKVPVRFYVEEVERKKDD